MRKLIDIYRFGLVVIIMTFSLQLKSQIFFKKYIDSVKECDDEFNTQVFTKNDSIFLVNFISCNSLPYFSNILLFDIKGNYKKGLQIDDLIVNIHSGHIINESLFIAGANNDENPDSKFILWNGLTSIDSINTSQMELFEPPVDIYLNPIGSVAIDSGKIIYGQYHVEGYPKVFSFLFWLNNQLLRDSVMVFDTTYDWSIISDATIDSKKNLVLFIEAANVIDHLQYHYRIIQKYNSDKEKIFEWVSPVFGDIPGLGSLTIIDSGTVVMEFVAVPNGHIHSLIAIDHNGKLLWEHIFHIDDSKSLYRINDIITTAGGDILCCGTYRNVSQDIITTGYVCKLDRNGNLLWERIFYDLEEIKLPASGIKKVIHFNSIAEGPHHSIVIGGRVIHNFLSSESISDVLLAVLDSVGCISNNCSTFQDITRMDDFLSPEKVWTEGYQGNSFTWSFRYKFDTIPIGLGGNIYYHLLRASSEFSENWTPSGYFRFENGRVYTYGAGIDQIIYNFNLVKGDTFHMGNEIDMYDLVVENIDTISLLNGDLKKRWILQPVNPVDPYNDNTIIWIEGVGNLKGLLTNFLPWTFDADDSKVLCVYWMNNLVYDNPDVDECWFIPTSTNEPDNKKLIVAPNPATEEITLLGPNNEIESVYVYNIFGHLVFQGTEDHIVLRDIPVGYYFMVIKLKNAEIRTAGFAKM